MGLEALSRGAGYCSFVDTHRASLDNIRDHLTLLDCRQAELVAGDALEVLRAGNRQDAYDVIFLDPPFDQDLLEAVGVELESGNWLAADARIYVESSARETPPAMPDTWTAHRDKRAGDVRYRLFVRHR